MAVLDVRADTGNTREIMDFVDAELERCNFTVDLRPEILIAVEEVFVNIASYAYQPEHGGNVKITVTVNGDAIIQFEDSGHPFNPLKCSDPDLDAPIMEREIGGLGIHFVKNMMDKVEYSYIGGKNIFTMTKGLSKQDRVSGNV